MALPDLRAQVRGVELSPAQVFVGDEDEAGGVKPLLVDLFCGAGGASMGYSRAGFDVIGVDLEPQKHYPFEFVQMDAIRWLTDVIALLGPGDTYMGRTITAIHASPPCQDHMMTPHKKHGTGWLLGASRDLLNETGLAWVIENVPGHRHMRADFRLCGCQFGLDLRRERWFETSWEGFAMMSPCHHRGPVPSVVGHGTPSWVREKLGYNPTIADYRRCMGIDWMNRDELSQAIPPAYTEFIGAQLMQHIGAVA